MSHFSVMVIVPPCEPEEVEEKVTAMLAPYHEFECTGVEDEYVVDVEEDIAALREKYLNDTSTRMRKLSDGSLVNPLNESGNYKDEFAMADPENGGRRRLHAPEGYEQVEVPTKTVEDFVTFVGPCPPGQEALHGDDVRSNNTIPNLRWGTRSQNLSDCWKNRRTPRGDKVARRRG